MKIGLVKIGRFKISVPTDLTEPFRVDMDAAPVLYQYRWVFQIPRSDPGERWPRFTMLISELHESPGGR